VGRVIAVTHFQLDPLRQFADKTDERKFTEGAVFRKNDPDSVQRHARAAIVVLRSCRDGRAALPSPCHWKDLCRERAEYFFRAMIA
jgi:hypothetical protein